MPDKVPTVTDRTPLAPKNSCFHWFYDPTVKELCQKTRNKADLSKDEILLLALAAGQAAFARYIEPNSARDAEEALDEIGTVLDHEAVAEATHEKARELLAKRQAKYLEANEAPQTLIDVLNALYESEINAQVSVASFWDDGWNWKVQLGDELNGFKAEKDFAPDEFRTDAALWLVKTACKQYPQSMFAKRYAPHLLQEAKAGNGQLQGSSS